MQRLTRPRVVGSIGLLVAAASLASAQPAATSAPVSTSAPATTRPADADRPWLGTFEIRYPGFRVLAEYPDARTVRWTILEGGTVGQSATETADRVTVAPGTELVSWTEASGAAVTQVIHFPTMRVTSTLVLPGGRRLTMQGEVIRLK